MTIYDFTYQSIGPTTLDDENNENLLIIGFERLLEKITQLAWVNSEKEIIYELILETECGRSTSFSTSIDNIIAMISGFDYPNVEITITELDESEQAVDFGMLSADINHF